MKLFCLAVVTFLCSTKHTGADTVANIQKNWNKIQASLPEPWSLIFEQRNIKPAEDNGTVTFCDICQEIVPPLKLIAAFIPDFDSIRETVYDACKVVVNLLNEDTDVDTLCNAVDTQGPPVLSIFKNRDATTDRICRNLNLCFDPVEESVVGKVKRSAKVEQRSEVKKHGSEGKRSGVIRFAQVADIHVDPEYATGSPSDCGLLVCCRDHYNGTGSAGAYGTYMCNLPQRTLELFLQKVQELSPDFVVHTGDNPTHHIWEETREESLECSNIVYDSLRRNFEGTPVYCAIGNHESFPTNLYYPENAETQDLLRRFVDWWGPLADLGEEQQNTVLRSAVYTVPTNIEGLRILSINSNFWYIFNFYNILNEDSEEEQYVKQFVEDSLASARAAGDKVLVLMHHPQGNSDNIVKHGRWYRQTVTEYSDVIIFGMSGHTHYDEIKLYRDPTTGDPNSVVHVAPSLTPMTSSGGGVNPSMRIFTLDAETFELVEIEQYQLDLSKVDNDDPQIELLYKFTEEYDLPDVSLQSMAEFMRRLGDDADFFQKWWSNRNTRLPRDEECIGECRREQLCQLDNVVFDEYLECVRETGTQKENVHPVAARYSQMLRETLMKN